MGVILENFCCIDNQELIENKNYPHSFNTNSMEERYQSLKKSERQRLPSNQIKLGEKTNKILEVKDALSIPISSTDIIVKKSGDPLLDYDILEKLGEGTFGKVYKVKNKHNKCIRAMKQIAKSFIKTLNDSEVGKEIEILKKLNHPYIIKLYEYYVEDHFIFLISEICEEGDLQKKIKTLRKLPEFIVKVMMFQVFKALMYLNEKHVIHGDLKLENILVTCYEKEDSKTDGNSGKKKKKNEDEDGFIEAIRHDINVVMRGGVRNSVNEYTASRPYNDKLVNDVNKRLNERKKRENKYDNYGTNHMFNDNNKEMKNNNFLQQVKQRSIYDSKKLHIFKYGLKLIDFGCSKIFTRYRKSFNDIIGTLVYCSPEVLANDYNAECDVWACGVLMYCLLSGSFPFDGETEEEITRKILSGKFEFDIDLFNNISDEAKDLIKKCLRYDVGKRISIPEALNHRFFNDLMHSDKFTFDEIKKLKSLKSFNQGSKFYQLVLTYLSYNFSDNKILNELNQIYGKIDRNSDSIITKGELFKAYKDAEIPITQEEVEKIIKTLDFDMNGIIDYEEFVRMNIPKELLFTDENLENAFLLFDTEKKGFITPSEIIDFIQEKRNINDDVKKAIKEEILDIGDEIIDLKEFKNIMYSLSGINHKAK